jgi:hypothetical protein
MNNNIVMQLRETMKRLKQGLIKDTIGLKMKNKQKFNLKSKLILLIVINNIINFNYKEYRKRLDQLKQTELKRMRRELTKEYIFNQNQYMFYKRKCKQFSFYKKNNCTNVHNYSNLFILNKLITK